METLLILPTTYLTTRAHSLLEENGIQHDMVIKPSQIFSDCGLAISVGAQDHLQAVTMLHSHGVKDTSAYVMLAGKWVAYDN